jgi:hypothetical protein
MNKKAHQLMRFFYLESLPGLNLNRSTGLDLTGFLSANLEFPNGFLAAGFFEEELFFCSSFCNGILLAAFVFKGRNW